jgi:hypothetical protein
VYAGCFQALALVETMSVGALFSRVEVKLAGAPGAPKLSEPRKKGCAVPPGTSLGKRDEVIHV